VADPAPAPRPLEPAASEAGPAPARWAFPRVVGGQVASLFGSSLTGFALGVWVYQATGSVTRFALISFFTLLPGILLSPLLGALVDRWDRRRTMILSDLGSGLCSLALALLLWRGALEVWHIYVLMALSSTLGAPQMLAFTASIPQLVSRRQLSRANGFYQLGAAAAEVGAPAVAGVLVASLGVEAALLVDFLTCLIAVGALLSVRIPLPERVPAATGNGKASLLAEAAEGWTYIRQRPGLFALMLMYTALNLSRGSVIVLVTPLILAFSSAQVLGQVLSVAASGMLAAGIVMTAWAGSRRRMPVIFASMALYSAMLFLGSLRPSAAFIALASFFLFFTGPVLNGLNQTLWHVKVPEHLQGRVTAMRRLFSWAALPTAFLVAGPLADHVFEPLMARGGPLAASVGSLIGSGPGRGIALFLALQAIALFALLVVCWLYRPLRRLDEEIPDVVAGRETSAQAEPAAAAAS
jgi:DHA3 family macrolide efflux protein-like MFS transporter